MLRIEPEPINRGSRVRDRRTDARRTQQVQRANTSRRRRATCWLAGYRIVDSELVRTGWSACLSRGDDSSVKRLVVDFQPRPANEVAGRDSQVKRIERG